jgi:hypothetical protein
MSCYLPGASANNSRLCNNIHDSRRPHNALELLHNLVWSRMNEGLACCLRREENASRNEVHTSQDTRCGSCFVSDFSQFCNERGKIGGSAEFVGKESLFRPALDHLDNRDTVGVAHWCDNGETRLDLLPTEDRDLPLRVLAETIKPISFEVGGKSNLVGEDTYRELLRLIIRDAHRRNPQPLPVIVFLDGDHTGQPRYELDQVVNDILETSGIVFGIKDQKAPKVYGLENGEVSEISHYVAEQTGGQYLTASAKDYATALDMILVQLHFRYELGFIQPKLDGKRHELKVELTKEAHEKYKGIRLKFRPEYIPVSEVPTWAR